MFLVILEPRNTSYIWYLNSLANNLKLGLEMAEKLCQKEKNTKQPEWTFSFPRNTINFWENGLMIHLASYIIKHVTCGRLIYAARIIRKKSPHYPTPWGI
jgi:hypothetical protein